MVKQSLKMNSVEFKMMSETHLKMLLSKGIDISIVDLSSDRISESTNKVSETVAKATKRTTTKSGKKSKDNKVVSKQVKVGDHFAQYDKDNKVVRVGIVKKITKYGDEDCVVLKDKGETHYVMLKALKVISKANYKKLKKSLSKGKVKANSTRLSLKDYCLALAYIAYKQDKTAIDYIDIAKATTDENELKNLYAEIRTKFKVFPKIPELKSALADFNNSQKTEVAAA